jgi:hypothetical protein
MASAFEVRGDLIIVHPSRTWDPLAVAEKGIHKIIQKAKASGSGKIYLLRHSDQRAFSDNYMYDKRLGAWFWVTDGSGSPYPEGVDSYYVGADPSIIEIGSEGGENKIVPSTNEVTIVGGYLEACLSNAMAHLMKNMGRKLKVHIYLPGVFTHVVKQKNLPEGFDIISVWPHIINPGHLKLWRSVGVLSHCPNKLFVDNEMFSSGGDYLQLGGGPSPEHFSLRITCNGQDSSILQIGDGGKELLELNFVTETSRD